MALLVEPIDRPATLFGDAERDDDVRGGPTLDDAVAAAWGALAAQLGAACPLCGGTLQPERDAAADAAGRCEDCGTTLA